MKIALYKNGTVAATRSVDEKTAANLIRKGWLELIDEPPAITDQLAQKTRQKGYTVEGTQLVTQYEAVDLSAAERETLIRDLAAGLVQESCPLERQVELLRVQVALLVKMAGGKADAADQAALMKVSKGLAWLDDMAAEVATLLATPGKKPAWPQPPAALLR